MAHARGTAVFGKRTEPHTIIIARGEDIRHFTVRPWVMAVAGSLLAAVAVGYLVATTYLVLRDDLIGASIARQARMQQAYEDRISALRAQVDRITSRQLLDQQLVENKVNELIARQAELSDRHGQLGPVLERAAKAGLAADGADAIPVPSAKPGSDHSAALAPLATYAGLDPGSTGSIFSKVLNPADKNASVADRSDRLFVEINRTLRTIESAQVAQIEELTESALDKAESISQALARTGYRLKLKLPEEAAGGPLLPPETDMSAEARFEMEVTELDRALTQLEAVKTTVRRFPIANPVPGQQVTSTFGNRRDPLIGRQAFHAGIDFRASVGHPVRAAGSGKVVAAGRNGGYGNMVEIDHGNGLTTRYAHLSAIGVTVGQKVKAGTYIGKAGNTGRSTGPHLHYEIRKNGAAINPSRFLEAGRAIEKVI